MDWQDIRKHYPHEWLLVEAVEARSETGKRILEQLAVVNRFPDGLTAWRNYSQLHRETPTREYYVLHTDRETLDIAERRWLGIRGTIENPSARWAALRFRHLDLSGPTSRFAGCRLGYRFGRNRLATGGHGRHWIAA